MKDRLSALYAEKLSPDNTIGNAMKGYTPAKRNSFVRVSSSRADNGDVVVVLRVQMHWVATFAQKLVVFASNHYLMKKLSNGNANGKSSE